MTTVMLKEQSNKTFFSPTSTLGLWIIVVTLATIFDAYVSWHFIAVDPVALEANVIWQFISDKIGFGAAMIVRTAAGVFMSVLLWMVGNNSVQASARRMARFGLRAVTVIMVMLVIYHIAGITYAFS